MFINKKKTHSNEFKNFLHHFKVKKGEEKTHYSIWSKKQNAGYAGSFNVPEKDMDDFYSTYFKCISTNKEDSFLVERHEKLSPILIDIDFRYPKTHNSRIYDKVFIQELLQLYMKRIEEYITDLSKAFNKGLDNKEAINIANLNFVKKWSDNNLLTRHDK